MIPQNKKNKKKNLIRRTNFENGPNQMISFLKNDVTKKKNKTTLFLLYLFIFFFFISNNA
jgi:hypothetical protein